jgi:hypothetical protein
MVEIILSFESTSIENAMMALKFLGIEKTL